MQRGREYVKQLLVTLSVIGGLGADVLLVGLDVGRDRRRPGMDDGLPGAGRGGRGEEGAQHLPEALGPHPTLGKAGQLIGRHLIEDALGGGDLDPARWLDTSVVEDRLTGSGLGPSVLVSIREQNTDT